jgi:hypothetical protein
MPRLPGSSLAGISFPARSPAIPRGRVALSFAFSLGALVINFTADTVIILFRPKAGRESAMAEQRGGGFVLSMKTHANVIGTITIDDATLLKVVHALGIPQKAPNAGVDKGVSDIESIYIYRGA